MWETLLFEQGLCLSSQHRADGLFPLLIMDLGYVRRSHQGARGRSPWDSALIFNCCES